MRAIHRTITLLAFLILAGHAVAQAQKPNVLFISVDDLNDWCGVMLGHPQARTPHLDKLAARGVFFDRAYCAAPSCNPSRVALLTGIRPPTSGLYVNDQKFRSLLPNAVTLPQHFTAHGYRVAGGGKIFHHGDVDPASWPEYFKQPSDPVPKPLIAGPVSDHFTWQPLDVEDEAMGDYKVVSWATKWLEKHHKAPFFLAVGFYRPHMPLHVPRKYFDAFPLEQVQLPEVKEDDLNDVPAAGQWLLRDRDFHKKIVDAGEWRKAVQGYLASVAFFDEQLGRLIAALDASPVCSNTIIVLWSDHGWHHGQKEHWSKFVLWEQANRVPFLIVAPGVTPAGGRCLAPVSLLDVYPTLAELCGLPRPEALEGTSLVPQLRDPMAARDTPPVMTFGPGNHAVRDARWRYIRYADGTEELYDHDTDPREWTNLAARSEHSETKARLAQWLPSINKPLLTPTKWLPPSAAALSAAVPKPRPATEPAGVLIDDDAAEYIGAWTESTKAAVLVGRGYRHDGQSKQERSARFTPKLTQPGSYEVRLIYPATINRATNATVIIDHAEGTRILRVNQREDCMEKNVPRSLGTFQYQPGKNFTVTLTNKDADGFVVIDAVQFVPAAIAQSERSGERPSGFTTTAVLANDTALRPPTRKVPAAPRQEIFLSAAKPADVNGKSFDLVVAEATPGGIAMTVRAAREGLSVLLVNHNHHLGGILSSGLGVWDTLWEGKRSPIYDEARQAIFDYYRTTYGEDSQQYRDCLPGKSGHTNGKFEPWVAEWVLTGLVTREKNITILPGFYPTAAERDGALLKSVTFRELDGNAEVRVTAPIFADCSYEGDLAAVAKVPYRLGRESRDEFREPHAGVVFMASSKEAPTPEIARAAELHAKLNLRKFSGFQRIKEPESTGAADGNVQAFNYRTPLSSDPANRLSVEKPANYDPEFLKTLEHGSIVAPIPNLKRGWNRPQLVGRQTDYVEADWPGRRKVMDAHWDATMALLYFLQNDPSVEPERQKSWREYGLAKNEFPDNGHRPYEFYVREARRITGRYIFTQHDAMLAPGLARAPVHADSIGFTEWYLDTHACTPRHIPGALEEGKMMLDVETFPGQVPYRALLPQGLDNLLVPVCLSSTHVAWGTVRLEPTWMSIAESAGHAAALAVKGKITPAQLNPDLLQRTLVANHIMVTFFNDLDIASDDPRIPAAQYFATKGFFSEYDARLDAPLKESTRAVWGKGLAALRDGTLNPMDLVKQVHEAEAADSPPLKRTRGESLLNMWQSLGAQKTTAPPKSEPASSKPRQPLKVQPVRSSSTQDVSGKSFDVLVIGGTPGGIACAVRAAREGLSVLLVQHNKHLGGMLTNGLMQWDALYAGHRSPIFNEYAKRIEDYYRDTYGEGSRQHSLARYTQTHYPMSRFEPSVVEHLFNQLVSAEKNITTLLSHHPAAVLREGALIKGVSLREYGTAANDIHVTAHTYVDATYEGDLAALAEVPYRVGREARAEFGEPHAGKVFTNISGESGPQDAKDGRINIHLYRHSQGSIDPTSPFTADGAIQAFNYRFCLSSEPGNIRLPAMPPVYNREEYVNYNRKGMNGGALNGKGTFNSAILPGENHAYPDASWPEREKIIERHKNFALGLIYFLQNDESVSPDKRAGYRRIGLPLDEYTDHDNLPYELYVREARRIVGRHVFTELDNRAAQGISRPPIFADSIAFTDWSMDSHDCTTDRRPGYDFDGKLILTEESRPAQIPYRSLLPQGVDNLLVPVCLSATHVAWGAVRLEPVWMQTGEAAGFAAALAKKQNTTPGKLDADTLLREMISKGQFVSFFNDVREPTEDPKVTAAQYFATQGFFSDYFAQIDDPLRSATAAVWEKGWKQLREGKLDPTALAREVAQSEQAETAIEPVTRGERLLHYWRQLKSPR